MFLTIVNYVAIQQYAAMNFVLVLNKPSLHANFSELTTANVIRRGILSD